MTDAISVILLQSLIIQIYHKSTMILTIYDLSNTVTAFLLKPLIQIVRIKYPLSSLLPQAYQTYI